MKSPIGKSLRHLLFAYNCTKNTITGPALHFPQVWLSARLPVELALGVKVDVQMHCTNTGSSVTLMRLYIKDERSSSTCSFTVAQDHRSRPHSGQKRNCGKKNRVVCATLSPGDRVLVKQVGWQSNHKLANRWDNQVHIVPRQPSGDIPMFGVQEELLSGRGRTLAQKHTCCCI